MGDSSNTASASATAMDTCYNDDINVIHRRVKKEEDEGEEEAEGHNMHNAKNCNSMNDIDNCNLNHERVLQVAVKKEEGNNKNDDHDHENNENNEASITPKSVDDNYDDWKNGNWCWLLPVTNNKTNINGKPSRQSNSSVTCTTGGTNNAIPREIIPGRRRSIRFYDDDNGDEDDEDDERKPRAKKKTRCCQPINDIVNKEEEEEEEEDDCVYDANNTTHTDTDNDSNNDNNSKVNDDEGYESWMEGNWCWVIPLPPPPLEFIGDGAYEEGGDNNKCNKDSNAYNDDGNNVASSVKSKKRWQNEIWDIMFQRLIDYKKKYKSTNVPSSYELDPKLGYWVGKQRGHYKKEKLSIKYIKRLNSIGFVWEIHERVPWEEMYQRLVAYRNHHNSTNVPERSEEYGKLGRWVKTQRQMYKKKEQSEKRIKRLESIGFVWDMLDAQWMKMYSRLVEYKRQHHGSTAVPYRNKEDPTLGIWVTAQRSFYNKGNLSGKRLEFLNSIDFVWSTKKKAPKQITTVQFSR
jgi:hypothetical protein